MSRGEHARDQAAAQVALMRRLLQQPAAVLAGWTPRGLRDSDAPRNKDGTYDAPKLVKWLVARAADPKKRAAVDAKAIAEQLQQEKLREARRNNDLEDGILVETEVVGQIMKDAFATWREQVKALEVKHGAEVGAAVLAMIDAAFKGSKSAMPEAKTA